MIDKPKKERRFLKALGRVGEILIQEVLLKVGSNLIKRIGGKKTLPSILFLFLSISIFAQYPNTGNKQRLGYQTTGDGLVYRGRGLDTMTIKSSGLNNAYFILDTVNNILYNYIKTKGGWKFSNSDTVIINNTVDTTSLSNRINLKVNISDTASMLLPYLRKADTASMLTPYFKDADTTSLNLVSRFATKLNISDTSSMLTNYLRSGIAAGTYLPLTGGTLTGALGVNAATVLNGIGGDNDTRIESDGNANMVFVDAFENKVGIGTNTPSSTLSVNGSINVNGTAVINGIGGDNDTRIESDNNVNMLFVDASMNRVGIGTNTPQTTLDVNGTFNASGNSLISGTLGVTGATTLSGALTVNNATVLNEGSGDFDTRIESDGNANMVFVDASTDRVGIGTGTPSSTLSVNGSVNATDLSLTNPLPITSGGTGAGSASVARTTLAIGYVFIEVTAGAAVTLTSNRVSLVNTGGLSTTQLDLTPATNGRMYMIKNLASGTVVSDASNVIPFAGGSAGTAILSAGNVTPQWCTLIADGTNWHIMQRN